MRDNGNRVVRSQLKLTLLISDSKAVIDKFRFSRKLKDATRKVPPQVTAHVPREPGIGARTVGVAATNALSAVHT